MGNTGLNRFWEAPASPFHEENEQLSSEDATEEETSSGSSEYRSAQGESFSDEDKQVFAKEQSPVTSTRYVSVMENKVEVEVLQAHYNDLIVDITHPYSLVSDLLQKQIFDDNIGKAMLADHFTRREKMIMLINAIINEVSKNPINFQVIVGVLENRPPHHSVAKSLLQSYGALLDGNGISKFVYSSAISVYAKDLKNSYMRLTCHKSNTYNLKLIANGITSTKNRHIIFQSSAFRRIRQSLFDVDSTNFSNIFKLSMDTEYVLIEGERCVGKTQLVRELCQSWDKIPELGQYQVILLLEFKRKHVQDIQNFEDLMCNHVLDVKQNVIQEICDAKGKDVLIIMDGFEQLSHTITRNHDSFIVQLLTGKLLPKSTRLVTATPSVIGNIISSYDLFGIKHIQLLGFHGEHFEKYSNRVDDMMPKQCQPHLQYLPINSYLVSRFHHKSTANNWNIPQTLTQYYSLYCLDLIWEYLSRSNTNSDLMQHPLHSFSDLHPDIHQKLLEVSKLALIEMTHKNSCSDKIMLDKDVDSLGLMSMSSQGKEFDIRFENYMLQAFLAAYYITQLEDFEQDQIFFNHSLSDMSDVWKFVAGLTGLSSTIIEILKSSVEDIEYLPFIIGWLYEQQSASMVKSVLECTSVIAYSLSFPEETEDTVFQCYALGYCISASNCVWNLNFSTCNLNISDLNALVSSLHSFGTPGGYTINSLQLDNNRITHDKIVVLSDLPLHNIRSLSLNSCCLTEESLDYLAVNAIPQMPELQELDIGNNCLHGINLLLHSLRDLLEFQTLNLDNTALDLEDMVPLNVLLSMTGSSLTQLSIGGRDIPPESTNLLIDTVLTSSSIETLRICDLDLTGSCDTFALLETNVNLNRLVFFECSLDLVHLATSLCMNTVLKQLEIFYSLSDMEHDIGPQDIIALTDMLEVNRSLSELSVYSYKPLQRKEVLSLVETLKYNCSLEILQLPYHYSQHFSTSELSIIDSRVYWKVWPCII